MSIPALSIVIPVYNEAPSLALLTAWIDRVLCGQQLTYEIIFMDDGSTDNSWEEIVHLHARYDTVRGISFRCNYGKSAALSVGFQAAKAPVVVSMDADMQDSPNEIPAMYEKIASDTCDIVSGWKQNRQDPFVKRVTSQFFNWITRHVSHIPLNDFNCGLKAYKRVVAVNLQLHGDMHRYIPVIASWQGFSRIIEQPVIHAPRRFGKSKYGAERFMHGVLDLLTVSFVQRFKKRPMHFFGYWGFLTCTIGVLLSTYLVGKKLFTLHVLKLPTRDIVEQPLFYIALIAVVIGVQFFLAGFLAEMVVQITHKRREYGITKKLP